jgi:hypothetical protein
MSVSLNGSHSSNSAGALADEDSLNTSTSAAATVGSDIVDCVKQTLPPEIQQRINNATNDKNGNITNVPKGFVLHHMKTSVDPATGYRRFTDLEVMHCGMIFIIADALSICIEATKTIMKINQAGDPRWFWMLMPWKTDYILGLQKRLAGHKMDINSATEALQAAIAVASYAVHLEQVPPL